MNYKDIKLEHRGAVALLTLNRPDALNALTVNMGQTADFREGVAAFIEKRMPKLTGG